MKATSFYSFLSIVLAGYGLINYFLLRRGWQSFKEWPKVQIVYLILVLSLTLAYPVGRLMLSGRKDGATVILIAGAFYLGFMFYLFLLVIFWDLIRLVGRWLHLSPFFPKSILAPGQPGYRLSFLTILFFTISIVFIGYINSLNPRIVSYNIQIAKPIEGNNRSLRIALISDLHLGPVVGLSRLKKIVSKINSLEPDLILLAGDIMDEAVTELQAKKMASLFLELKAGLGTVAVSGNHETYSRQEKRLEEITEGRLPVLTDETIILENIVIVGRKDRAVMARGGRRLKLEDLLDGVERSHLILLLDHQPVNLEEAEKAGVDLQVSGHTHAGQLFPLNWINRCLYEKNWGYYRRGHTHYYISCGVATWGPPLQTAARPEIVLLILHFS